MRDLARKDKLVEAAGDAYGETLSLDVLDVCSEESIKQCIDGIKDRHVDVLSKRTFPQHAVPLTAGLNLNRHQLHPLSFLCFLLQKVSNAGIGIVGPVECISIEEMKRVFETNVFGTIRVIKEVMADMKRRRGGHIIVISSVMGLQSEQAEGRSQGRNNRRFSVMDG